MAAGDLALSLIINASQGNVGAVLGGVVGNLRGLAGSLGPVGIAAGVAAVAVVAIGASAVEAAGSFQTMTNTLVTSAGESVKNLDMIRQGMLAISVETGTSTTQLAGAMYQIESSGQHGAAGLNVLKVAAMGAKSENADLTTVAKALTTVLTDYHMPATMAASAMNGLITVVQNGKTTLQELAGSMGAVLPIASALGISFPQVGGAIATMTNAGMPARQAAMNLAHVLVALSAPSAVAVKAMKSVGLSADGVKNALVNQGLPEALQEIEDAVGKKFPKGSVAYETALKNILGGLVGFKLAAMLTGDSLKTTEENIKKVAAAMGLTTGAVLGFDVVQGSFNFKVDQGKAALNALMIVLGTALLPAIGNIVSAITGVIVGFTAWELKTHAIEKAIGVLGVVFNIIGAIFSPIVKAIQNFATAASGCTTTSDKLHNILKQIGTFLVATFKPVWEEMVKVWKDNLLPAWNDFMKALQPAIPSIKLIAQYMGMLIVVELVIFLKVLAAVLIGLVKLFAGLVTGVSLLAQGFLWLLAKAQPVWQAIADGFQWLYDKLLGHSIIPDMVNGITGWFTTLSDFILNIIQEIAQFLVDQWNTMVADVTAALQVMKTTIATAWNTMISDVKAALKVIQTTLVTAWNTMVADVKAALKLMATVFSTAYQTYIASPLASFVNAIKNIFTVLVANFGTWATSAIKMFATNIIAGIADVTTAATGIANTIKSILGISSPAQTGPLSTSDQWMPNLMTMLAAGIAANIGKVMNPLNALSNNISAKFTAMKNDVSAAVGDINRAIGALGQNLSAVIANIEGALRNLQASLQLAATGIGMSLGALAGNINGLLKNIVATVQTNINNVGKAIASGTQGAVKAAGDFLGGVGQVFHNVVGWLGQAFHDVVSAVGTFGANFNKQGAAIKTNVDNWAGGVAKSISDFAKKTSTEFQNWGLHTENDLSVVKWHLQTGFDTVKGALGQDFQNVGKAIVTGGQAATKAVDTAMTGLQTGVSKGAGVVNTAIGQFVGGMGQKFQGGVQAVDTSMQTLQTVVSQGAGQVNSTIVAFVGNVGQKIQTVGPIIQQGASAAESALGQFKGAVDSKATQIVQGISQMGSQAGQVIQQLGQTISQGVSKMASTAGEGIGKTIGAVKDGGEKILGSIKDTMTQFAAMIASKGAAAVAAATGIAAQVAAVLGHSTPKEGPMKDDDKWGEHFTDNIVKGMRKGMGDIDDICKQIGKTVGGSLGGGIGGIVGSPITTQLLGKGEIAVTAFAGVTPTPASSQPMVIHLDLDKKTICKVVTEYQRKEIHAQGGYRSR